MARDYVTIGSSPAGEDCAQVGRDNYYEQMRKETSAFIKQLRRQFGEHESARIHTKSFPHDFGSYHEVVVSFNDNDEAAMDYAYNIENNTPELWDEEALAELGIVR